MAWGGVGLALGGVGWVLGGVGLVLGGVGWRWVGVGWRWVVKVVGSSPQWVVKVVKVVGSSPLHGRKSASGCSQEHFSLRSEKLRGGSEEAPGRLRGGSREAPGIELYKSGACLASS